jgi:hypothetical protein
LHGGNHGLEGKDTSLPLSPLQGVEHKPETDADRDDEIRAPTVEQCVDRLIGFAMRITAVNGRAVRPGSIEQAPCPVDAANALPRRVQLES